jgi:hypothetical protein
MGGIVARAPDGWRPDPSDEPSMLPPPFATGPQTGGVADLDHPR